MCLSECGGAVSQSRCAAQCRIWLDAARALPQLTISPTHNSSPNDLTLATSLSRHTCRLRALSSPRSPSLIGWGVAGAPPRITIHRFVRGAWLEPRPRGLGVSSCGWSRSSKPLAASPHFARLPRHTQSQSRIETVAQSRAQREGLGLQSAARGCDCVGTAI
jgi:hypothetical protein